MRVSGIRPGDIVRAERNGRLFLAEVRGKSEGVLDVDPITHGVNWFTVKPRQVRAHWRKARA